MNQHENLVFCFDTSAFIDINRYFINFIPSLTSEMDKLFNSGSIISHEIVYEEITTSSKKPDSLSKWIHPKRAFFHNITAEQAILVSQVVHKYPTLIHYNKEKDDADPWLIAMVIEKRSRPDLFSRFQEYAIVSAENASIPNRLPSVCKNYSIKHFGLPGFFSALGWSIDLKI